jgi:hypothetical protein
VFLSFEELHVSADDASTGKLDVSGDESRPSFDASALGGESCPSICDSDVTGKLNVMNLVLPLMLLPQLANLVLPFCDLGGASTGKLDVSYDESCPRIGCFSLCW